MSSPVTKLKTTSSPPKAERKKYSTSERLSVEELRKKYEPLITGNRETTPFEQLKQKYESNIKSKATRLETAGSAKISKVQEIASMFNSKVNAVTKRHKITPDAKSPTTCDLPQPWPMPEVNNNKEKSPVPSPRMKTTEHNGNQPKPWPMPRANGCKEDKPIARPRTKSDANANQPKPWPMPRTNSCKAPTPRPRAKLETKADLPKPWPLPRVNSCEEETPIARPRAKSETKADLPKPWPMPRVNSCEEETPIARPRTKSETKADLPKPLPMPRVNSCEEETPIARLRTKSETKADLPKPLPMPRTKIEAKIPNKNAYFAVEEHFEKLSVKDKALLYTQFVSDMTKRNPKFIKHAKILEENVLKDINRDEVIDEKQSTVKDLLQELEARCCFPKQFVSPLALQYVNTLEEAKVVNSKEFEQPDDDEEKLHRATFSFNPPPSPAADIKKVRRRARSLPRCHVKDERILKELSTIEPSVKRYNDQMHTYLPIEAYAPPKKIRRTRAEVLSTKTSAKEQHMQNLFYTWLNEKQQGNEEDTTQSDLETKSTSTIDKLLEETIDKLETLDDVPKVMSPTESVDNKEYISISSSKPSETEESESGITPLAKITSEESQADNREKKSEASEKDLTAPKYLRPLRKKKLRRTLAWKKEATMEEARTQGSTESDSDSKLQETKAKNKLIYVQAAPQTTEKSSSLNDSKKVTSFMELNKSFLEKVNSPWKIKSAYTLTVCSPPHCQEEPPNSDELDCTLTNETTLPLATEANHTIDTPTKGDNFTMTDSFIDQGFETGTNDMDSPISAPRKSVVKMSEVQKVEPLFIQMPLFKGKTNETPSSYSTPIKGHTKQANNFACLPAAQPEQVISPITMPLKTRTRRCTNNDNEPRHSTYTMAVIREDQMLEHHEITSPIKLNNTNAPASSLTNMSDINAGKTSQFWIKSGGICISLDIFYNTAERLRLLYEIFSQKSFESRDLHFGIDDHKFSLQHVEDQENIIKRLPNNQECSHYWFASGDLAVPFSGKIMPADKIQRLFEFVKANVEETGILRFGVDNVEFSNVPEFWSPSARFSMDSNYSMLVGLQSGNSNGLEGRSKFAWPNRRSVKVTDLDESVGYDNQNFEENESCLLSFSPFGNNSYDLANINPETTPSMLCRSDNIKTPDSFLTSFENDSLDLLFAENYNSQEKTTDNNATTSTTVPEMLSTLKSQQQRLSDVKERLSIYCKPINKTTHDDLDALKGTPEYIKKLKSIVTDILQISNTTGFKDSTVEELEYYMFYLSRYADICLHDCSDHMDRVLDALMDKRSQQLVN